MGQLRYVEISRRNPITRILVGGGLCAGDITMEIRRSGSDKCAPKTKYNACCQIEEVPRCDVNVATVTALEIDDNGYAIFEWPTSLLSLKEGWYQGTIRSGCSNCGEIPIRIGPRCNVLKVETDILGPDSLCEVGCDDDCPTDVCKTSTSGVLTKVYIPDTIIV